MEILLWSIIFSYLPGMWNHLAIADILNNLQIKGGEYCDKDAFSAQCPGDHVIQIVNGSLGRMRSGRCTTDPLSDCQVDTVRILHRNCSGLTQCHIEVSTLDKLMADDTKDICPRDFRLYLESYYRCIPVQTAQDQSCKPALGEVAPILVHNKEGFLASQTTRQTGKGSDRCPWHVQADPGQTIQLSLLDMHSPVSPGDGLCQIYAYITDNSVYMNRQKLMDCGFPNHGQIITSLSESVDITILDAAKDRNFIIHYEAIGCADINPEGGSRVLRRGNRTEVTCGDTIWTVECNDGAWIGDIGQCDLAESADKSGIPWPKQWGQELTIVMIIAVAIVIAVIIVVVGICIVRRRAAHHFQPVSQNIGEYGVYGLQGPVVPGKSYYPTLLPGYSYQPTGSDSSHYTTTMERRQAFPPNGYHPPGDTFPRTHFLRQNDVTQPDMTSCSSCPVHTYTRRPNGTYHDIGASGWQTFPIRRAEHIYASPNLGRKNTHDAPYYHELDPQEVERQLMEQRTLLLPPPNIPVPPIPQEDEGDSDNDQRRIPTPPPPPLPPDNLQKF